MYGTASKLGKMLIHIKWIVLAKENNFLLSRPVALYTMIAVLSNSLHTYSANSIYTTVDCCTAILIISAVAHYTWLCVHGLLYNYTTKYKEINFWK